MRGEARLVLRNERGGQVLARRLRHARGWWERSLGLLVLPPLRPGDGLWLDPCGSIHTWGMRYPIDVVFLDREGTVLRAAGGVRPWRFAWAPRGTRSAVELPAGSTGSVRPGDRLTIESEDGRRC